MKWIESQVETSAGTVRFREAGSGPALLFVHGALVDSRIWDETAEQLVDRFRCILPDLPMGSHPLPMAADADLSITGVGVVLAEFLDAVAPDGATLVANDSGGTTCQILVTQHPELIGNVRGLVLTNTDAFDNFPPGRFKALFGVARARPAMWMLANSLRIPAMRRSPVAYAPLAKRRIDGGLLKRWVTPSIESAEIRRDFRKLLKSVDADLSMEAARRLPGFERPTLFAWAPEDPFFPVNHADRLAASMPDAKVVRIPDAKTFVMLDQPGRLAVEIAEFVSERVAPAAAA